MTIAFHPPLGFKPILTPQEYAEIVNLSPRTVKEKALAGDPNFPIIKRRSDKEPVRINYMKVCIDLANAEY